MPKRLVILRNTTSLKFNGIRDKLGLANLVSAVFLLEGGKNALSPTWKKPLKNLGKMQKKRGWKWYRKGVERRVGEGCKKKLGKGMTIETIL